MELSPKAKALLQQANANTNKILNDLNGLQGVQDVQAHHTKDTKDTKDTLADVKELQKHVDTQESEEQDPDYPLTMSIRGKVYHYRPWKVKDMKKYRDHQDDETQSSALVCDCIKEEATFDTFEFMYALIRIRQASVPDKISYQFKCPDCEEPYEYSVDIDEIIDTNYADYVPVEIGDKTFVFQDIQNRELYERLEKNDITDLICHIKTVNGEAYTLEETISIVDDLNIAEFRKLQKEFNDMRFKITLTGKVVCPHCGHETTMIFDTIPDFVPPEFQ